MAMKENLDYIKAYGVSNKSGNLLYKELKNGQYLTAAIIANNIDIYILNELYDDCEEINKPAEILSFNVNDSIKVARFKELIIL